MHCSSICFFSLFIDPDDCQFDGQGMCFWTPQANSNYKWSRNSGRTPSSTTGPDNDHSTRNANKDGKLGRKCLMKKSKTFPFP